mmetsp:Transcript_7/g.11  ORF Transcript_7/g.11 Transcript_7/m.11 type:complete len:132 (-) Transcript_7:296-691(-)
MGFMVMSRLNLLRRLLCFTGGFFQNFAQAFNARSEDYKKDIPIPVVLTAFSDRTFEFVAKTPSTSYLLKKAANIEKGAKEPGTQTVATVSVKAVYEIAKLKQTDPNLQAVPLKSICKSIIASAKSMGVKVV